MKYFNNMYLEFFRDLKKNNNKEWFQKHKEIYRLAVHLPFNKLLTDVIASVSKLNSRIQIAPEQALFRINKDMRFNKGGGPYKLFRSALVSEGNRKSKELPSFYLEIGLDGLRVGGGIYSLKDPFKKNYTANWSNQIIHPRFYHRFEEVKFESKPMSLTYQKTLDTDIILSDDLLDTILDYWVAGQEVNRFFWE